MFVGLHAALAVATNNPELEVTDQEGKAFTVAAQNVLRHYSVETTQKTMDWIAFMGITAGIYVPRVMAMGIRKASERAMAEQMGGEIPAGSGGEVVDFVPFNRDAPPPYYEHD